MATTGLHQIELKTKLLYGVFATEKSFLVGCRRSVKRAHADMLAMKATGHRLPTELVHCIADALYQLESSTVESKWNSGVPHRENVAKFRYEMLRTPAERFVLTNLHNMGVNAVAIRTSDPRRADGTETRGSSCYVHLSATTNRPTIGAQLVRGTCNSSVNEEYWCSSLKHAGMSFGIDSQHYDVQRSIDQVAGSWSTYRCGDFSNGKFTSGEVTTCTTYLGLEDAIRNWDSAAIEAFVTALQLEILPSYSDEPLRPSTCVWQFLSDR